jgi:hypothetical protein
MARKTRKNTATKKGIYSIPELRRAFEHIEQVADQLIRDNKSKDSIIKSFRKEWSNTFHKELDKKSADAFITHRMESKKGHRTKGGAAPLAGAPLDSTVRPGIYLDQGRIPGPDGGLTATVGGGYGNYVQYVDRGFFNPEIAHQYDPIKGQSVFPLAPRVDMGSNAFKGGNRSRKTRKSIGGGIGATLQQAFTRPIPADVPTNPLFDMQSKIYGINGGMSPDQVDRSPNYQLGSVYPRVANLSM